MDFRCLLGVFGFVLGVGSLRGRGSGRRRTVENHYPGRARRRRGLMQHRLELVNTAPESSDRLQAVVTRLPSGSNIRRAVTSGADKWVSRRIQLLSRSGGGLGAM